MSGARPNVSLCMIVRDEEACLERCLESVKDLVDEIIIVDTGSTDRTPDIARQYKARITTFAWVNDFSAARNFSLDQATGAWVMYLDADEELVNVDKEVFAGLLAREEVEGYYFNILSPTGSQAGGQELRHVNLRLFRNRPHYRFRGAIHEQIVPSILASNPAAKLLHAGITIYHHGYRLETLARKNKPGRNLAILQQQVAADPGNNFLRYNLGVALYEAGDLAGAIREWQQVLAGLDMTAGYAPTLFRNYAICLLKNNQPVQALEVAERGLGYFPGYTDLHYLQGQALARLDRYTRAQDAFLHCLELGEAPAQYVTTAGVGSYLALYNLGQIMEKCGYWPEAVNYYQKAFNARPDLPGVLTSLGRALQKVLPEPMQVRAYIQDNIKVTSLSQLLQVGDILYATGDYHGCLLYLNEAIICSEAKIDDITMLKARCLMRLGRWEEAKYQCLEIAPESPYYPDALVSACICNWSTRPVKNAGLLIEKVKDCEPRLYSVLKALNHKLLAGSGKPSAGIEEQALEGLLVRLCQAGNPDLARQAACLTGDLPEGEIDYRLGRALFNHCLYLDAARYLLPALEAGVEHDDLFYMLGCICAERNVLWEAEQLLHQALSLNPGKGEYHEKLVEVLLRQTAATLQEAIARFPASQAIKDILARVKECQLQLAAARGGAG